MFTYKKIELFTVVHTFSFLHSMTFDLISGLHMQIQTWHPPLWLCTHAKYYVKSGLTNVLKNANKTKNMHLFLIRIANYLAIQVHRTKLSDVTHRRYRKRYKNDVCFDIFLQIKIDLKRAGNKVFF